MTETFKKLYQGELPNSVGTLYTVPASTQAIIKYMVAVNTTISNYTMTLWQDGTADENRIFGPTDIPAGGKAEFDGSIAMAAGGTLRGEAESPNSITLTVSGLEVS